MVFSTTGDFFTSCTGGFSVAGAFSASGWARRLHDNDWSCFKDDTAVWLDDSPPSVYRCDWSRHCSLFEFVLTQFSLRLFLNREWFYRVLKKANAQPPTAIKTASKCQSRNTLGLFHFIFTEIGIKSIVLVVSMMSRTPDQM